MNEAEKQHIRAAWRDQPEGVRSAPATEDELRAFEARYASIPADVRWFLAECGGGPVGSEWVDSINELPSSHDKFAREADAGGWTMRGVFIIGWDGSGNPFGIRTDTGEIVVEDHTFGGIHSLAPSFGAFLLNAFPHEPGNA